MEKGGNLLTCVKKAEIAPKLRWVTVKEMKTPKTLFLIASLLMVGNQQAAIIYSDNFNSYTANQVLPTGASEKWSLASNTAPFSTVVLADGSNIFGAGTSNNYLSMGVATASGSPYQAVIQNSTSFGLTGQASFSFFQASGASTTGSGLLMRLGTTNGNGSTAFALSIDDGKIYAATTAGVSPTLELSSFSFDTAYKLTVVFNNSNSAFSYDGGTVNARSMDIWLNNVLIGHNLAASGSLAANTNLTNLNFTTKGDSYTGTVGIDDLVIMNAATIPEPSSLALLGMGAVAFVLRRKSGHTQKK